MIDYLEGKCCPICGNQIWYDDKKNRLFCKECGYEDDSNGYGDAGELFDWEEYEAKHDKPRKRDWTR